MTSRIPESSDAGRARILVCDDSATVRSMMAAVLGRAHRVLLTASAEEALQRAPEFSPDLVVTDLLLPGMSGRDLVARLRAIPAFEDVPMVLLTGVGDADSRADGLEAGADDYILKPVRERDLLARVASLLRLRRTVLSLSQRTRALEEANAALAAAQERLARSERLAALGSMAAALAHDINNPLSLVSSGAAAIQSIIAEARARPELSTADQRAGVLEELRAVSAEVAEGSRRLLGIGRDLRLFAAGGAEPPSSVSAEEAVEAAISLARARGPDVSRVDLVMAEPLTLAAPPHLATLALLTFLDRAVGAAGAHGTVRVEVRRGEGGTAEVAIQDDGPRIPDALLPRVFEPFSPVLGVGPSKGLGLSVGAGIVLGLGGHVDVDPNPPAGACFRVRLPLAPPGA